MLKAMFDIFEPTEKQLTPAAIMRLRISMVFGFFALPIFAAVELLPLEDSVRMVAIIMGVICYIGLVYGLVTRMANRLWVPEKYLDESEIEIKRRSASLAYQIMMFTVAALIATFFVLSPKGSDFTVSARSLVYLFGSLMCAFFCFQTFVAAMMIKPLSDGDIEVTPMDKRYGLIIGGGLITLTLIGAVIGYLAN